MHILQVSLVQQRAVSMSQWVTCPRARNPSSSGGIPAAECRVTGAELPHNTNPQLVRPKTGGSDKGRPNTMFIFSLQLFSGSQNDSLERDRAVANAQMPHLHSERASYFYWAEEILTLIHSHKGSIPSLLIEFASLLGKCQVKLLSCSLPILQGFRGKKPFCRRHMAELTSI